MKTKCSKCKRDAKVSLGYGESDYCDKHFLEFIEKRIRKDLRISQRLSTKKEYFIKKSPSSEYALAKYYLGRIFNGHLNISSTKRKGRIEIIPRFLEGEASDYIESFAQDRDFSAKLNPLRTVLFAEAAEICRILKIPHKKAESSELMEKIAEKHPETKFSVIRFMRSMEEKIKKEK